MRLATEELLALDRLEIAGLMTMAPFAPEPEHSRRYFRNCANCAMRLEREAGVGLPHLSMGMSGDYVVAVEEGATLVRVGSAIFGTRSGKQWSPGSESV